MNDRSTQASEVADTQDSEESPSKELKAKVEAILEQESIPSESRGRVVEQVAAVVVQESFGGPLPHPLHLEKYEAVCPGAADRILSMAETTLDHNIHIGKRHFAAESRYRLLGLIFGFVALLSILGCALWTALSDKPVLATAFLATGVLGAVWKLIDGRSSNKKDEPQEKKLQTN